MARQFRAERNHQVLIAIDTGRLMCEPLAGIPKVDHAVNAALLLAYVSLRAGDRVGLATFDARPGLFVEPKGGLRGFDVLSRMGAQVDYSDRETNFTLGLTSIGQRLSRRSLMVVLTDFVDTVSAELMVENLDRLSRRHLLVFVALQDPGLAATADRAPRRRARAQPRRGRRRAPARPRGRAAPPAPAGDPADRRRAGGGHVAADQHLPRHQAAGEDLMLRVRPEVRPVPPRAGGRLAGAGGAAGAAGEGGLKSLTAAELHRLPVLYRSAISSLSVATAISLDKNLLDYLTALVGRAYIGVYGAKRRPGEAIAEFFRRRFPAVVRRYFAFVLAAYAADGARRPHRLPDDAGRPRAATTASSATPRRRGATPRPPPRSCGTSSTAAARGRCRSSPPFCSPTTPGWACSASPWASPPACR